MPVKKSSVVSPKVLEVRQSSDKKTVAVASLRAKAKQSSTDTIKTKIATKPSASRNDKLSVPLFSLAGRESGTLSLPEEIFGVKVNKQLLSQALRVYMTNQQTLLGSTKGRGEVEGSTAKIFRQKGTGRARHGAIRAPIFVGGGIVFGPKPRKVRLDLPKKMKKAALLSAFSAKALDKSVVGLTGIEKASGKTKELFKVLNKISGKKEGTKTSLIVINGKENNVVKAVRNIPGISVISTDLINAYEVLRHELLILSKEAIEGLTKTQVKEQK